MLTKVYAKVVPRKSIRVYIFYGDEFCNQCLLKMGMSIISYTFSSVRTANGYLAALGKPSIALIKRDARIGEAEANKDAQIAIAQAIQQQEKNF